MKRALAALDAILPRSAQLIIGGGGGMALAYAINVRTDDIDAYSKGMSTEELDPFVKKVAARLGINPGWLNAYYTTFAHVLPPDYGARLREVFRGKNLTASVLGPEDLLIMKCFAGRKKDVPHARALLRLQPDLALVERHIESLRDKSIPRAQEAMDFLDDILIMAGR